MTVTMTKTSGAWVPGGSFHRAFMTDFRRVASFFPYDHRSLGSIVRRNNQLDKQYRGERKALAESLLRDNTAWDAEFAALSAARRLEEPGAAAVVAQVRPQLLGGGLPVVLKALSVVTYARRLEEICKVPVVPILWVIADHNWGAMGRTALVDSEGSVVRLALKPGPQGGQPSHRIPLHPGIDQVLGQMQECLRVNPVDNEMCSVLRHVHEQSDTLQESFCRLAARLFSPWGVLVADESSPDLRKWMAPVLQQAALRRYSMEQELAAGADMMKSKGFSPVVPGGRGRCHLFMDGLRGRLQLFREEDRFSDRSGAVSIPVKRVAQVIAEDPQLFSPGEVLRPLAQDAVLPVMAYVAGPDESPLRAQAKGLWELYRFEVPPILPRISLTLFEPEVVEALRRRGLTADRVASSSTFLELIQESRARQLAALGEEKIDEMFGEARHSIQEVLDGLHRRVMDMNPAVDRIATQSSEKISSQMEYYENKVRHHLRREHREILRDFRFISSNLSPDGEDQQHMSFIPMLIRYDRTWMDRILDAISDQERLWEHFAVRWDSGR